MFDFDDFDDTHCDECGRPLFDDGKCVEGCDSGWEYVLPEDRDYGPPLEG